MGKNKEIEIHNLFLPIFEGNYRNYVFHGGRDSTKSWSVALSLVTIAHTRKKEVILCAKGTQNSISDSVKALIENMISLVGLSDYFEITEKEIVSRVTGSKFIFKGLQRPDRLKSLEGVTWLWIEEANVDTNEKTFEVVVPTIRKPGSKIILTFNPEYETDYIYQRFILHPTERDYVREILYTDNKFLSDESRVEIQRVKEANILKYNHIYGGECIKEIAGALWATNMINHLTIKQADNLPDFDKLVVAIDPSVTNKVKSDECGIVVAGKSLDRFTVLQDESGKMSPNQWAQKAIDLYKKWAADHITAESNQGGDLIKLAIHNIDKSIPVRLVHASRGKMLRAEPISLLYERGLVDHIKVFSELEFEMVTYTGEKSEKSPNRLDALVWALTDLSKGLKGSNGLVVASPENMATIF